MVASRQGAPLTEPPSYGEASPAREHLVLYDDGSSEWLTLKNEKVRYVQATRAAQLVGQVTASLSADDDMDWFAAPVEAEALGLVDYHTVVSEPMDLGTVEARVEIFKLYFNLGFVGVWVRCSSLYVEEGISRRSCPSLSRKHNLTHWLISHRSTTESSGATTTGHLLMMKMSTRSYYLSWNWTSYEPRELEPERLPI